MNEKTYQFDLCDQVTWLGSIWNLQNDTIDMVKVSTRIMQNMYELLSHMMSNQSDDSARKLASFVGIKEHALGNISQLMTRNLCMLINISNNCHRGWDYRISISVACVQNYVFGMIVYKAYHLIFKSVPVQIFSDASASAGADFTCTYERHSRIVHYKWNELE